MIIIATTTTTLLLAACWRLLAVNTYRIVSRSDGQALTVVDLGRWIGPRVIVSNKTGLRNQLWYDDWDGFIRSYANHWCLYVNDNYYYCRYS